MRRAFVKMRWLPMLMLTCLWLGGCPAYSLNPLYTSQDAVVEPALAGKWISLDADDKEEIVIQKSGDHEYKLSSFDPNTKITSDYDIDLVRLGGKLFMNLQYNGGTLDGATVDEPMGILPMHMIMKVEVSGDDLAFATMEDDAIKKQGAKYLKYEMFDQESVVLVTAETIDLRKYVAAHTEDGFSQYGHLRRLTKTGN